MSRFRSEVNCPGGASIAASRRDGYGDCPPSYAGEIPMRWTVEGADSSTGRETAMTVEARTREEAEQQARYNGLLVSVVYPHGTSRPVDLSAPNAPAVVNYAGPTTPPSRPEPPPATPSPPQPPRPTFAC